MDKENQIVRGIQTLFISRNNAPLKGLLTTWYSFLKDYKEKDVINVLKYYIKHGDDFPSLPKIIKLLERDEDAEHQSLESWKRVRKYLSENRTGIMTDWDKEVFYLVCPDGMSDWINASSFSREKIEREYKKACIRKVEGKLQPKVEYKHNKQLNMDFTK
jgi:hypothetical protein